MNARLIVSAIVEKEGLVLLGKKAPNVGPYPNTWHLLGGGVDIEQESLEGAIRREIKEEAGIEVGEIIPVSFDEDNEPDKKGIKTHYVFLQFKTKYVSGKLKPNGDIDELRWFTYEELKSIALPKVSVRLFQRLNIIDKSL